jgi:hypothetical protein
MKKNFIVFIFISIIIIAIILIYININKNAENKFNVLSHRIEVLDDFSSRMVVEFVATADEGIISLFNPAGQLIEEKHFEKTIDDVFFDIGGSRTQKPATGNYTITFGMEENGKQENLFTDSIWLKKADIFISDCEPIWFYDESDNSYILHSINLTFTNVGDIFGQVWEGKLIIDNSSNLYTPNYHWHDLDIWVIPDIEVSEVLPVDISWLSEGGHHIRIQLLDRKRKIISDYEEVIYTV